VGVIGAAPRRCPLRLLPARNRQRVDLDLHVDILESRDFLSRPPQGCNMCGGIGRSRSCRTSRPRASTCAFPWSSVDRLVSPAHGRGSVLIRLPFHEMRIGAVPRGAGPRNVRGARLEELRSAPARSGGSAGAHLFRAAGRQVSAWRRGSPSYTLRTGQNPRHLPRSPPG